MTTYYDSSALLRALLGQPGRLANWPSRRGGIASALVRVECLRTLDRLRVGASLADDVFAPRREAAFRLIDALDVVAVDDTVLERASQPFPTELTTLDAIHLATALLYRERSGEEVVLATHDGALARAARACGLSVIGVD